MSFLAKPTAQEDSNGLVWGSWRAFTNAKKFITNEKNKITVRIVQAGEYLKFGILRVLCQLDVWRQLLTHRYFTHNSASGVM